VWTSVLAQWPRRGLSMSEPRRGGPSSPRHGDAMEPTATVTGGPARQAQHEWLPDGFGSLSQSCGRCLLVTSRSRHRWPGAYKCRPAAAYKRCRAAASGELHTSKEMLCCAKSAYCFKCFRCFRGMLQMIYMDVAKVEREFCTCCICWKCFM
jgi:hypothetical protein